MPLKPVFPRAPFTSAAFAYVPYTAASARGPVAQSLKRLLDNLGETSLDGTALSALLPAAYLIGHEAAAALGEAALARGIAAQGPDGDIPGENLMERIFFCQAVAAWYEAKRPAEALPFLLKFCQYVWDHWEALQKDAAAMAGAGEWMALLSWLYHVTGKKPLLRFMDRLRLDALDWTSHFHTFAVVKPMERVTPLEELESAMAREEGDIGGFYTRQYYLTHGEYTARGLKTPALFAQASGSLKEKAASRVGYERVMRYHGAANGMFNADPLLGGGDPARPCRLDFAGEWAWSLGEVYRLQGEGEMADALERVAYNALRAGESQGLVQPRQAVNAIDAKAFPYAQPKAERKAFWGVVKGLAALLRTQYLALENEGLALAAYEESCLRWRIKGVHVTLTLMGNYPGEGDVTLAVEPKAPVEFILKLRIPGWCQEACVTVNDEGADAPKAGEMFALNRTWQPGDRVAIRFPMPLRTQRGYHQSAAVFKGSSLLAIPAAEEPWRFALDLEALAKGEAFAYEAPGWEPAGGRPKMPGTTLKAQGAPRNIDWTPYGETRVHMAQFPVVDQ